MDIVDQRYIKEKKYFILSPFDYNYYMYLYSIKTHIIVGF